MQPVYNGATLLQLLLVLLFCVHVGLALKGCVDKCRSCKRGQCFTCDMGFWGVDCDKECSAHCVDRVCSRHSPCLKGCVEGWYGLTCDTECAHCEPGGCSKSRGYCNAGCLPDKCGPGCPCKKDKYADDHRHDVMDSIPNNIIAAFVIGVVFVVFIVFIFCGYTKCPEKDVTEERRPTRASTRSARRTASSTPSTTSYRSNGRSDATSTSPLYPQSAVANSYRSNMTSDAAISPPCSGAAGSDVMLNLAFDQPPPYGSLGPALSSPSSSEQPTPPPTYESLFPIHSK